MQSVKKLLEKNPALLRVKSRDEKREIRQRYEEALRYDKVEELAREYVSWRANMPNWKVDHLTIEKNFIFGRTIAEEYAMDLLEIERLFNEVLPQYRGGGFLGFFISGMYRYVIEKESVLRLNTMRYSSSISGLGYQHMCGRLEILGDKVYYVGMEMANGEISVYGNVGNYLGKSMKGGCIYVDGNARNWVGAKMEGGCIMIKGSAGDIVGEKMTGGEIIIGEDAGYWVGDDAAGGMIRVGESRPVSILKNQTR